jgi:hypothetical protein
MSLVLHYLTSSNTHIQAYYLCLFLSLSCLLCPSSSSYLSTSFLIFNDNCVFETLRELYIFTYNGLAWLITVGSRFDDWIYWTSVLQLHLIITSHTLISLITTSVGEISHCYLNLEESLVFEIWFSGSLLRVRVRVRVRVTLRLTFYLQSVRLGDKPLDTHDQNFYFPTEHLRLYFLCNILSEERMGLSFAIAPNTRQRSHSQVRVPRDSWLHFTVSDPKLPEPGEPGPHIYIPQEQGGPVIPPRTGYLFVAS